MSNNDIANQIAFQEEEHQLIIVEGILDSLIEASEKDAKYKYNQARSYSGHDGDEKDNIQYWQSASNHDRKKSKYYKQFKDSPYFIHVDVVYQNKKLLSCYIGEKGISEEGISILSWNTPFGIAVRKTTETTFEVNGIRYICELKRNIDIQKGVLKTVSEVYNANAPILQFSKTMDPFLLGVLRRKREINRITNIIKTIAQKQAEIISLPINTSCIVQGCAGSGKSMVLLHRLSYLAYNNDPSELTSFYIITPGNNFDQSIRELCTELNISVISRYTVDDFYRYLIYSISSVDTKLVKEETNKSEKSTNQGNTRRIVKVNLPLRIESDTRLGDDQLLRYIYSNEFKKGFTKCYKERWESIYNRMISNRVFEVLEKRAGFKTKKFTFDFNTFTVITNAVSRLLADHKEAYEEIEKYEKRLRSLSRDKNQNQEKMDNQKRYAERIVSAKSKLLKESEYIAIQAAGNLIKECDIEELIKLTKSYLEDVYSRFSKGYSSKYYRHKLYVMLMLCYHYYGSLRRYISRLYFDEGQNISPIEYSLFKDILGGEVVFNIYGDLHQRTNKSIGIEEWNDLIDLTDNIFTLSENYRNSNQIIEYCNSLFKMSVEPIGIDGEDILELNCDEAIIRAVKMYRKDNTKRYAIIHSGSSKMIRKCIPDSIIKYCAFENVLPEKISVLSVDASKGLEFEGVVAITPGMNKSEKYVAFTRALDNLIVVNSLESK